MCKENSGLDLDESHLKGELVWFCGLEIFFKEIQLKKRENKKLRGLSVKKVFTEIVFPSSR